MSTSAPPWVLIAWCLVKNRIILYGVVLIYAQGQLYIYLYWLYIFVASFISLKKSGYLAVTNDKLTLLSMTFSNKEARIRGQYFYEKYFVHSMERVNESSPGIS
jgi:hypothetical protein